MNPLSGSVSGLLVIIVWFILVCHVFQLFGGVHVRFSCVSVRRIMVQLLVACDQIVVQLWFSCVSFRRIMVQRLAACD